MTAHPPKLYAPPVAVTDSKSPHSPSSRSEPSRTEASSPDRSAEPNSSSPIGGPRLRPPLPTLVELGHPTATETLRPPGAVPPPPRSITSQRSGTRPLTPIPLIVAGPNGSAHPETSQEAKNHSEVAPSSPFASGAPSTLPPATSQSTPKRLLELITPPAQLRSRRVLGWGISALFTLLIAWQLLPTRSPAKSETHDSPHQEAIEQESLAPVRACEVAGSPRKLAESVQLDVPLVSRTLGAGRIALAYAASPTHAVGLTLDPATLDAAQAFSEPGREKLRAIVPLVTASAEASFATSRTSKNLSGAGLVQLPSGPAHLLLSPKGLEVRLDDQTHVAFPDVTLAKSSSPRAEALGTHGVVFTLRRGGGEILVGQLDQRGRPQGQLTKVTSPAREFGAPQITAGPHEVLLSVASRETPQTPWRIELARAPLGQLPVTSRPFVPEGLSESAVTLSPGAAALPDGGWLLQWTQGEEGKHRVWLQTLDQDLTPVGAPFTAGPSGGESGQGAPWVGEGKQAASFYIVRSDKRWELWGTALTCPR